MTAGRVKAPPGRSGAHRAVARPGRAASFALCDRPLGVRVEWHHAIPKSEGRRDTVPVHPICHRAIHAAVSNPDLARTGGDMAGLRDDPKRARFVAWVADKPPDFHAPTRRGRG